MREVADWKQVHIMGEVQQELPEVAIQIKRLAR
jgi:uncharacterized protein YdeI (BOF family)